MHNDGRWLCANPDCCLDDGHVPPCREAAKMLCGDCGAELDADERRFVDLRADRRLECASCWHVRVVGKRPGETIPAPAPSDTIRCAPRIAFFEEVDDLYLATSLPRVS